LMLVYGLSSTGATINLHYCCGKLHDVSFSSTQAKACPAKTVSSKGCCDTKHVQLNVKGDQEPAAKWISGSKDLTSHVCTPVHDVVVHAHDTPVNEYATGPPLIRSSVPLFVQHCTYLI
jgi:hypothetical protein